MFWNGCAGAALLLAIFAVGCDHESTIESRLREAAVQRPRPLEGRLSAESRYESWTGTGLSERLPGSTVSLARGHPAPRDQRLHTNGLLFLFRGDLPAGVKALEASVEQARSPQVLADLSAAYLGLAREGSPWLVVDAVAAAEAAVEIEPRNPKASFNLALALDRIQLPHQALLAWERYLDVETDSDWSAEARIRLERARKAIPADSWPRLHDQAREAAKRGDLSISLDLAKQFPRPYREMIERELLPEWANSAGNIARSEALTTLQTAAKVMALNGDRLYLDSSTAIERGVDIVGLAAAHAELARGLSLRADCHQAAPFFERAVSQLEKHRSPMALAARLESLTCRYRESPSAVEPALRDLAANVASHPYPTLLAKTQMMIGLSSVSAGHHSAAIAAYRKALDLIRPTDPERARFLGALDEACFFAGDRQAAWHYRLLALESAAAAGDRRIRHATLMTLAQDLAGSGHSSVAREVLAEMLANAQDWGEPGIEAEILLRKLPLDIASNSSDVELSFAACKRALDQMSQPADRERLGCELEILESERWLATDPAAAANQLEQTVSRLGEIGYGLLDGRALLALGRARIALHDSEGAAESFGRALEIYEERREATAGDRERIAYFATAQEGFDAMIRLQAVDRRDARTAFLYAERIRARGLRDRLPAATRVKSTEDLQSRLDRLPENAVVLSFVILPERLLIFRLRRGSLDLIETPQSRGAVAAMVTKVRATLMSNSMGKTKRAGGEAYTALLEKILTGVSPNCDLFLMPDRELYGLPFGALFDTRKGRFVIEDHTVTIVSSLDSMLNPETYGFNDLRQKLLVVGNPELDQASSSELTSLPGAEMESRAIAALYPGAELLTGRDATSTQILKSLPGSRILHLATHVELDPRDPLASIIFTAGPEPPLRATDLDRSRLEGVKLVFLSTCDSGPGFPDGNREGTAGLARAVLSTGVSFVVSTLWSLDDRSARWVATSFYRNLLAGESPAAALATAQRSLLESEGSQGRLSWAPLQIYRNL